jgi:hypothetical protein
MILWKCPRIHGIPYLSLKKHIKLEKPLLRFYLHPPPLAGCKIRKANVTFA